MEWQEEVIEEVKRCQNLQLMGMISLLGTRNWTSHMFVVACVYDIDFGPQMYKKS